MSSFFVLFYFINFLGRSGTIALLGNLITCLIQFIFTTPSPVTWSWVVWDSSQYYDLRKDIYATMTTAFGPFFSGMLSEVEKWEEMKKKGKEQKNEVPSTAALSGKTSAHDFPSLGGSSLTTFFSSFFFHFTLFHSFFYFDFFFT